MTRPPLSQDAATAVQIVLALCLLFLCGALAGECVAPIAGLDTAPTTCAWGKP